MARTSLTELNRSIIACRKCPRLLRWCGHVAKEKRAAFRDQTYYGRPVPNLGQGRARLLIVGLAPAAHGANRTGRMFTGDRSGKFLFRAMYQSGFANQSTFEHAGDGLKLQDALITAACHCAPPANRPTRAELDHCGFWLSTTIDALPRLRAILCLGGRAFGEVLRQYRSRGWIERMADFKFAHGAQFHFQSRKQRRRVPSVLCSYHPSQQNTFTGRLTEAMLREIFERARTVLDGSVS